MPILLALGEEENLVSKRKNYNTYERKDSSFSEIKQKPDVLDISTKEDIIKDDSFLQSDTPEPSLKEDKKEITLHKQSKKAQPTKAKVNSNAIKVGVFKRAVGSKHAIVSVEDNGNQIEMLVTVNNAFGFHMGDKIIL